MAAGSRGFCRVVRFALRVVPLAAAASAPAQEWVCDSLAVSRWPGVYDTRRHRFVRLPTRADGRLLESVAGGWQVADVPPPPFQSPAPRDRWAAAFDSPRGRVLMFGGSAVSTFGDLWSWDGATWTQLNQVVMPPRRADAAMAWNPASQRMVLYGGRDGFVQLDDTWEFDGSQWTQLGSLATTLPAAVAPRLGFDPRTNRLVLVAHATFALIAGQWTQRSLFAATAELRLCTDEVAGRLLMASGTAVLQLREFVDPQWNVLYAGPEVGGAFEFYFDRDRDRPVIVRTNSGQRLGWNGTGLVSESDFGPGVRSGPVWYDDPVRGEMVSLGGSINGGEMGWAWNGNSWRRPPATSAAPFPRLLACGTYDPVRGTGLMFGGINSVWLSDLWSFDGTSWTQLASPVVPTARLEARMAFDTARGVAVLFGGIDQTGQVADTWEWNGQNWSQRLPAVSPPASYGFGMSYDQGRNRTVLLVPTTGGQTWEWDGANWQRVLTPNVPSPGRYDLTFDPDDAAIAAVSLAPWTGVWRYDGVDWTQRNAAPLALSGLPRLAFDSRARCLVLTDGNGVFRMVTQAATAVVEGSGCGAPPALLQPTREPALGRSTFGLDAAVGGAELVLLGFSASAANIDLGNGCTVRLGPLADLRWSFSDAGGLARFELPVPASPSLVGAQVLAQALALAPTQPGGLRVTPALRLVLGD